MFQLAAKNTGLIITLRFPGTVRASMGKILRWCCKPSCAVRKEENALGFPVLFQDPRVLLSCLARRRRLQFSTQPCNRENGSMLCKFCLTCWEQCSPKVEVVSSKRRDGILHVHTQVHTCDVLIHVHYFRRSTSVRKGSVFGDILF